MPRIHIVHWNAQEAAARAALLGDAGYEVVVSTAANLVPLRAIGAHPPDAIVIDLTWLPSQSRDVAISLRVSRATRRVPLVLVGGAVEAVARLRQLLPDANYTTWDEIGSAVAHALENPPADPVVPESVFAGYSGTPLPQKLGIKVNAVVALIGAPDDFAATLGELPAGVTLTRDSLDSLADPALWFVTSRETLTAEIEVMATRFGRGRLWIVWPKRSSGRATDLSEPVVRTTGLAFGLVDYKIAAIDSTWSGLLFTRRRTTPLPPHPSVSPSPELGRGRG